MHPVKAEEAIAEAYFDAWRAHLLARFAWKSSRRSSRATARAPTDLTLCVRLRVSSEHSKLSLASKFGVGAGRGEGAADRRPPGGGCARHLLPCRQPGDDARRLCASDGARARGDRRGGGHGRRRSMSAAASRRPIRAWSRRRSSVIFETIHRAFESLPISYSAELWCEPGRALCAEYSSLVVRVEKRRGDELYINDGAYGALFDAAHIGWRFPVAAAARAGQSNARDMEFSFYGPTCDDIDHMAGPFLLPADIAGRRLYRDRHARRLWLRDADRVQRLRHRTRR